MSKKPLILGIESSCDETAASIITENEQGIPIVLSNVVSSQVDVHKEFGGVVPELAARSHMEKIDWIVQKAIDDSGKKIEEIDAVASTAGQPLMQQHLSLLFFFRYHQLLFELSNQFFPYEILQLVQEQHPQTPYEHQLGLKQHWTKLLVFLVHFQ